MFSIIVPTFNNIEYLKLCLESIRKNSKFKHEIIIHINEGKDGSLEFIKNKILNILIVKKTLAFVLLLTRLLKYTKNL